MQKSKIIIVNYSLIGITIVLLIFFLYKTNAMKTQIATLEKKNFAVTDNRVSEVSIVSIDSIFFTGKFDLALQNYENRLTTENDSSVKKAIEQRIQLVLELIKLKKTVVYKPKSLRNRKKVDEMNSTSNVSLQEIKEIDSLNFIIAKAMVQIQQLKIQLKQKTAGEYLTFESSKGNTVHYVGVVRSNMANGKGVALLNSGSRYEGGWKNNLRHGKGIFYWPDGEYYEGEYKEDKRHGFGTYYWPNGDKFAGNWGNDKRNGEGTFYDKDGQIVAKGIWKNDELAVVDKK